MHNVKEYKGEKEIRIYTPEILAESIIKYTGNDFKNILDVCCGDFNLSKLYKGKITGIDLQEPNNSENKSDKTFIKGDFFDYDFKNEYDLIVCNPPFNGAEGRKLFPELFLDKILELFNNTPIVLICPIGVTFNQKITSKRWKKLSKLNINACMCLPLDIFSNEEKTTLIHSQVLFINFKQWKHNGILFINN